jgi:hypothetical protein
MSHANPPAFPRPASVDTSSGTLPDGDSVIRQQDGMSLRDYFAGQALAGWFAQFADPETGNPSTFCDSAAKCCYAHADAMLAARSAKGGDT